MGKVPLSPLRYPGGKTRFVPHLLELLDGREFTRVIEPFCGGASVSLGLVDAGLVKHAVIRDKDPLVSAFWVAAVYHTEALIQRILDEQVTVSRWMYWNSADPESTIDRAVKALFKNRTTFSGLIHHGSVLGGVDQEDRTRRGEVVKYPVGCRFNKSALKLSLERIGQWSADGKLSAGAGDYRSVTELALTTGDLVYLDPPYVEKSIDLYGQTFTDGCHTGVARVAIELDASHCSVLISYDDLPLIRGMYPEDRFTTYSPKWAYGMGKSKNSRELLISNFPLSVS